MGICHKIGLGIIFLSLLFINSAMALPDETNGKTFRLMILPFHDYSSSDKTYLSEYLKELLENEFSYNKKIELITETPSIDKLGSEYMGIVQKSTAKSIAERFNADAVIGGRYIVGGNRLRVYFYFFANAGNILYKDNSIEYIIDDDFLKNVDNFPSDLCKITARAFPSLPVLSYKNKEDQVLMVFLNRIRSTPVGSILKNQWVFAIFIIIMFIFFARMVVVFFERVLKKLTSGTESSIDNDIIEVSERPVKWIIILTGFKLALLSLSLKSAWPVWIDSFLSAIIILLITYIAAMSVDVLIRAWGSKLREGLDPRVYEDLVPLFVSISKILILSFGCILVLSRFDIDIAPFIASLGIAGFAIGFAIKDTLANVIGGVVLILDRSFSVGDKVTIDEDTGIIKEVGLRNTKIVTYDHEVIVIPNGELINKKFKNYVLPDPQMRVVVSFGVVYGSDVDQVEQVVLEAVKSIEDISTDPEPIIVFVRMGDFSLDFEAKFWVSDWTDHYMKKREATKKIYNALNRAGIGIPFPTHTVYLERNEGD